jgi:hypothetical protein
MTESNRLSANMSPRVLAGLNPRDLLDAQLLQLDGSMAR